MYKEIKKGKIKEPLKYECNEEIKKKVIELKKLCDDNNIALITLCGNIQAINIDEVSIYSLLGMLILVTDNEITKKVWYKVYKYVEKYKKKNRKEI